MAPVEVSRTKRDSSKKKKKQVATSSKDIPEKPKEVVVETAEKQFSAIGFSVGGMDGADLPRASKDKSNTRISTAPVSISQPQKKTSSGKHMVFDDPETAIDEEGDDLDVEEDTVVEEAKGNKRSVVMSGDSKSRKKQKQMPFITTFSFKNLTVGTSVLCAVKEIRELELIVSLPFNIIGVIPITQISTPLLQAVESVAAAEDDSEEEENAMECDNDVDSKPKAELPRLETIFSVGQLLTAIVTEKSTEDAKKRVELSANPNIVNKNLSLSELTQGMPLQVAVSGVEDHGLIVDLGIQGAAGFIALGDDEKSKYSVGQIISGNAIVSKVKGRTVNLKIASSADKPISASSTMQSQHIIAGMPVSAKIIQVCDNGLSVKFFDYFTGFISYMHAINCARQKCPNLNAKSPLTSAFKPNESVTARILYALPSTTTSISEDMEEEETKFQYGLTLQPHLISLTPAGFPPNVSVGSIFDNASISHVENVGGVFFSIPLTADGLCVDGFVHISRCSDDRIDSLEGRSTFQHGTVHKARVIDMGLLDGMLYLSLEKAILKAKYLRYSDIKPGQTIRKAIVTKFDDYGNMHVVLCDTTHIKAICPPEHLADVPKLSQPERKFKPGSKVNVRILSVDYERKRVKVTCKPSLVNMELPLLHDHEQIQNLLRNGDLWTIAVISAVKDYGCFVSFFGDLKGFLHISQTAAKSVEEYVPGQLLKCKVIGYDEKSKRIRVTTRVNETASLNHSASVTDDVKVGQKFENCPIVDLVHGGKGFWVELKLNETDSCKALLPANHTTDITGKPCSFNVGHVFKHVVVVELLKRTKDGIIPVVSAKNLLLSDFFPQDWDTLKPNSLVVGFVRRVDEKLGVFVTVGKEMQLLAPKRFCSDLYIKKMEGTFVIGQTVIAAVMSVDVDSKKANISLKTSDIVTTASSDNNYDNIMAIYSEELLSMKNSSLLGNVRDWEIVSGDKETGFKCKSEDLNGFMPSNQVTSECKIGDVVTALIMDVDEINNVADISCKLVNSKKVKNVEKFLNKSLDATVELSKSKYAVVSLKKYPGVFGKVACVYPNNLEHSFGKFANESVKVCVKSFDLKNQGKNIFILEQRPSATSKNAGESPDLSELKVGAVVKGKVTSIKAGHAIISLTATDGNEIVEGRIHSTELLEETPVCDDIFETAKLKEGMTIEACILGFISKKTHKWLSEAHNFNGESMVELTLRPSIMKAENRPKAVKNHLESLCLKPGHITTASVYEIIGKSTKYALKLIFGPCKFGRVQIMDISNDPELIKTYKKHFTPNQVVRCGIKSIADDGTYEATLRFTDENRFIYSLKSLQPDDKVSCRIVGISESKGINVVIALASEDGCFFGNIPLTEINTDFEKVDLSSYKKGDYLNATVLSINEENHRGAILTLRKDDAVEAIRKIEDVQEESIVKGFISNISSSGIFIMIGVGIAVRVKISELSDLFLKDWKNEFNIGQIVSCKILHVDAESRQIEGSMKLSSIDPKQYALIHNDGKMVFEDLKVGQIINGTVAKMLEKALFIDLDETKAAKNSFPIRAYCSAFETADDREKAENFAAVYSVGDRVKCKIKSLDAKLKRVSLGMKPSYFVEQVTVEAEDSDIEMEDLIEDETAKIIDSKSNSESDEDPSEQESEDSDSEMEDQNDDLKQHLPKITSNEVPEDEGLKPLDEEDSFKWEMDWKQNVTVSDGESASDGEDSDSEDEPSDNEDTERAAKRAKRKAKREKQKAKLQEESEIQMKEQLMALGEEKLPETADDFDRLLLTSPNSSFLWIQYMAFYVNMIDVVKARQIAEKALTSINFREEKEKFNVWTAYLNLENKYGTPESLKKVFDRAVSYNEPKHVYLSMATIYENTEKFDKTEEIFKAIMKKFKTSCKIWLHIETYYFKHEKPEESRKCFQRSLSVLPKHKHVKAVTRFARLEYELGNMEKGRTLLEGIISNYPKRVDVWSMFVDIEIKYGNDVDMARKIMERAINLKLSARKMKALFKKYLDLEKKFGNEKTISHVVDAATAYVEALSEKN